MKLRLQERRKRVLGKPLNYAYNYRPHGGCLINEHPLFFETSNKGPVKRVFLVLFTLTKKVINTTN